MAPSDLRVIISLSLLVPSRQRMKKAPAGLFDPWTCEWQLTHSLWFASAELKNVLGGAPRCGIAVSPPNAPPLWSAVAALWQDEQRKLIRSRARRASFEPCGVWQFMQLSRTGWCSQSIGPRFSAWQL